MTNDKRKIMILLNSYSAKIIINWFTIISGLCMTTLLLGNQDKPYGEINLILSLILLIIISLRFNLLIRIYASFKIRYALIALLFSFVFAHYNKISPNNLLNVHPFKYLAFSVWTSFYDIITYVIVILGLFAIFSVWYTFFKIFIPLVIIFLKSFNKFEIQYMMVSILLYSILIVFVQTNTTAFFMPLVKNGSFIPSDIIYTADSGSHTFTNVNININASENDLRQPLFAIFAMPFGIISKIISWALPFLPNSSFISTSIIHLILMNLTYIMVSRMLNIRETLKKLFLITTSITFPFALFSIVMEQYVIATFWMIIFIFSSLNKKSNMTIFALTGATGAMLTSGILAPLLLLKKDFKITTVINYILNSLILFISFTILSGQVSHFIRFQNTMVRYKEFTGAIIPFISKLQQFSSFVLSCFVYPDSSATFSTRVLIDFSGAVVSYDLVPVYQLISSGGINLGGVVIFILALISFLINYKDVFARICLFWVLFSFVILCVIGWGTAENGLVLYIVYFSWAFTSLIFLLFDKLFNKFPLLLVPIYFFSLIVILTFNIVGMYNIINFAIKFYPA
ncbi:hypothetical protein GC102_19435 [Paenibacillus sp. LMG 31460]|uniref:Uncharacterized protein n=1 Tax=Paenibacillus germinis TaxID=2654979 RepID=A0ABX1Z7Q7_9BACL|nr:hypothetical protein [Paenibacillus germinis]NOU87923.1 hypothetical protein [Paenibacillus germinis]